MQTFYALNGVKENKIKTQTIHKIVNNTQKRYGLHEGIGKFKIAPKSK